MSQTVDAIRTGLCVASVVSFLHSVDIVHRDLKASSFVVWFFSSYTHNTCNTQHTHSTRTHISRTDIPYAEHAHTERAHTHTLITHTGW